MPPAARRRAVLTTAVLAVALTAPAAAAPDAARPRVAVVSSATCEQTDFICAGFKRALPGSGVDARFVSPDPREDMVGTLSLVARQGYDLVVVDLALVEALQTVAPRFPRTRFALYDAPWEYVKGRPRNVQAIVIQPREAAYLAGWLAARMEQRRPGRDVVSAVGGARIPPVDTFLIGFHAGARAAVPGIRVLTAYSEDFADPTKCRAIARSQIARGSGVVFNVAGGCGLGALQAAREGHVWGIGVDTDQASLGPHILTSVVKRYDTAFRTMFASALPGRFRTGTRTLGLRDAGAGLGRISPRVPVAVRRELEQVRRRLVAGTIRVQVAPSG